MATGARSSAGSGNYARNASGGLNFSAQDITWAFAFWVNLPDVTVSGKAMQMDVGATHYFQAGTFGDTSKQFQVSVDAGAIYSTSPTTGSDLDMTGQNNNWVHIGYRYTHLADYDKFFNGTRTNIATSFGTFRLQAWTGINMFGFWNGSAMVGVLAGAIADAAWWVGNAPTDAEFSQLAAKTIHPDGCANAPARYWKCDESSGSIIDYSGNGVDLTVTGTLSPVQGPFAAASGKSYFFLNSQRQD